jgi:membrane protein implicated in regulation of membrane protease activity
MISELLSPWFVCGLLLCLLEMVLTRCVLLFFGLSCIIVSFTVVLLDIDPGPQWLLFCAVSLVSLLILRRLLKRLIMN